MATYSAEGATECSPARKRWENELVKRSGPEGRKNFTLQSFAPLGAETLLVHRTQRSRAGLHSAAPSALSRLVVSRNFEVACVVLAVDANEIGCVVRAAHTRPSRGFRISAEWTRLRPATLKSA